MPYIIADRFLAAGRGWLDLATGSTIRLRVTPAETRLHQAIWNDTCATLARLRHPLVNPLFDFGVASASHVFEAYATAPPIALAGPAASRLLVHAARFLEAHAVQLTRPLADFVLRSVTQPRRQCGSLRASARRRTRDSAPNLVEYAQIDGGRAIGVAIQHRRVLDRIAEALTESTGGPMVLDVCGGTGSGLRTLHVLVARTARLCGYAPVSAVTLQRWPWVADALVERHVCILVDGEAPFGTRATMARFLTRLGMSSSRMHAVIGFRRSDGVLPRTLQLEPLGTSAMIGMVYVEPGYTDADVFAAARKADGRPGLFLHHLRAATLADRGGRGAGVVHEAVAPYTVSSTVPSKSPLVLQRRTSAVASRACVQGARLAERGRHAAAARILSRAFRVLNGRGDTAAAAATALQLGWLVRERGQTDVALQQFERARTIHPHEQTAVAAALAIAVAWTDAARLHEAEAAARAARAAAENLGDVSAARAAAVVLARTLLWQLRLDEAVALLEPILPETDWDRAADAWALFARAKVLAGDPVGALKASTQARRIAHGTGRARSLASANRAAAVVAMHLGDLQTVHGYVEEGLRAARTCHAPLVALRLRSVLLTALKATDPAGRGAERLAAHLRLAAKRPLPALLRWQLHVACHSGATDPTPEPARTFVQHTGARALLAPFVRPDDGRLLELQQLLELCHAAVDDRGALERMCGELCTRLNAATVMVIAKAPEYRRLAIAGRPWPGEPHIALRALDGGMSIPPRATETPLQGAEPVHYGGESLAAVCCRWGPATLVEPHRAAKLLRFAALVAGPLVRNLLDSGASPSIDHACPELLGASRAATVLRDAIRRAARAPFPVLIEGESGTGKELVARAIHRLGPRRDRRWCAINCAALTDDLVEAELFGHARGAFTGAVAERAGLFEEADGGTLFLDEIGELSPRAQAKLLRVLQEGEVRRVGENFPRRVDARVIAATNRQLADEVSAGRFRPDLRFRLDVVRIEVPPLRAREEDIPVLALQFWREASARVGSTAALAPEALAVLTRYDWPGNVRELQNVIASMAVHAPRRGRVTPAAIPVHIAKAATPGGCSLDAARNEFERRFIRGTLARTAGNRARAACALGVSRQGLAKMMKRLGME